jgi:hypothetical protein
VRHLSQRRRRFGRASGRIACGQVSIRDGVVIVAVSSCRMARSLAARLWIRQAADGTRLAPRRAIVIEDDVEIGRIRPSIGRRWADASAPCQGGQPGANRAGSASGGGSCSPRGRDRRKLRHRRRRGAARPVGCDRSASAGVIATAQTGIPSSVDPGVHFPAIRRSTATGSSQRPSTPLPAGGASRPRAAHRRARGSSPNAGRRRIGQRSTRPDRVHRSSPWPVQRPPSGR